MPWTFALTAPLHPVLHRVSSSYEKIPNAPEHYEMHQNMIYGPMGWIRYFGCEKLHRDFVARTFALIAPVLSVLQQVSCSYETIPNGPKYYETHQNIRLGCNGVDWVHSLWKIPAWLRGTNFCINCTSSPRFATSFMQLRNNNKCTQTLWNAPKHEVRVQWGGPGALVVKNYNATSWHKLLH